MASYSYVLASDNYINGSADSNHNNNFFATSGSTIRIVTPRTITNSTDTGIIGEMCVDSNYLYLCTATNTWIRFSGFTW